MHFFLQAQEALAWVMQIAEMDFDIVLPAHFDAPIYNGKRQLIDCFDYVLGWDRSGSSGQADRII